MTTKAEGRHRGNGKRPIRKTAYPRLKYHNHAQKANFPRLNSLVLIELRLYKDELTRLEITREISGLVDCCDVILSANEGGHYDR